MTLTRQSAFFPSIMEYNGNNLTLISDDCGQYFIFSFNSQYWKFNGFMTVLYGIDGGASNGIFLTNMWQNNLNFHNHYPNYPHYQQLACQQSQLITNSQGICLFSPETQRYLTQTQYTQPFAHEVLATQNSTQQYHKYIEGLLESPLSPKDQIKHYILNALGDDPVSYPLTLLRCLLKIEIDLFGSYELDFIKSKLTSSYPLNIDYIGEFQKIREIDCSQAAGFRTLLDVLCKLQLSLFGEESQNLKYRLINAAVVAGYSLQYCPDSAAIKNNFQQYCQTLLQVIKKGKEIDPTFNSILIKIVFYLVRVAPNDQYLGKKILDLVKEGEPYQYLYEFIFKSLKSQLKEMASNAVPILQLIDKDPTKSEHPEQLFQEKKQSAQQIEEMVLKFNEEVINLLRFGVSQWTESQSLELVRMISVCQRLCGCETIAFFTSEKQKWDNGFINEGISVISKIKKGKIKQTERREKIFEGEDWW